MEGGIERILPIEEYILGTERPAGRIERAAPREKVFSVSVNDCSSPAHGGRAVAKDL
jgi:hypothetical protein